MAANSPTARNMRGGRPIGPGSRPGSGPNYRSMNNYVRPRSPANKNYGNPANFNRRPPGGKGFLKNPLLSGAMLAGAAIAAYMVNQSGPNPAIVDTDDNQYGAWNKLKGYYGNVGNSYYDGRAAAGYIPAGTPSAEFWLWPPSYRNADLHYFGDATSPARPPNENNTAVVDWDYSYIIPKGPYAFPRTIEVEKPMPILPQIVPNPAVVPIVTPSPIQRPGQSPYEAPGRRSQPVGVPFPSYSPAPSAEPFKNPAKSPAAAPATTLVVDFYPDGYVSVRTAPATGRPPPNVREQKQRSAMTQVLTKVLNEGSEFGDFYKILIEQAGLNIKDGFFENMRKLFVDGMINNIDPLEFVGALALNHVQDAIIGGIHGSVGSKPTGFGSASGGVNI